MDLTQITKRILAITCPRCSAQAGEKCCTPDGGKLTGFHAGRLAIEKSTRENLPEFGKKRLRKCHISDTL